MVFIVQKVLSRVI